MEPPVILDPEDSTHRQSSGPSTEHETHTRNLEITLDRFRMLQEEQIRLLRELLGQPTSIPISPENSWDWEHGLCVPHPCYCCRSQPRYRQIFGFVDDKPLRREKDFEGEPDLEHEKIWINLDCPSDERQEVLRSDFAKLLPADCRWEIEWWPQVEDVSSDAGEMKRIVERPRGELGNLLKEAWSNIKFPVPRADSPGEHTGIPRQIQGPEPVSRASHLQQFDIDEPLADWNVISTGKSYIEVFKGRIPYEINENSGRIITGRYIECLLHEDIVTFKQIALFCCMFSSIMDEKDPDMIALIVFLQAYTSAWEPTRRIKSTSDRLFQQFHFRYPEVCSDGEVDRTNPRIPNAKSWIRCTRDKGKMPKSPDFDNRQTVVERRVSVLFATRMLGASRPWKIFTFADKPVDELDTKSASLKQLLSQRTAGQPSKRFFALLNTLRKELKSCVGFWGRTLDLLEKDLRISANRYPKIDKITDGNTLKLWMFDGDQNERSEQYFECLSMLQIFSDWVEDTSRDLHITVEAIPSSFSPHHGLVEEEIRGIEVGVDDFLKQIDAEFGPITARIKQTQDEIIVLRDGMFNSTSIREAREATHQGYYIHVFTTITILYLPLAFVTGLFGMNNLENVNSSLLTSWTPFIIVFTVVATVTYVLAGLSIPWVHWNDISRKFIALKKQLLERRPVRHGGRGGDAV